MTEHIETGTQTSPTAEYEPLKVDFTPTPAVVPLVAWTWNTPVIPQFYWNVYSAEQRIKQICLEIGRIQEYLNYFAAHYNKMSGYLNKRIDKLTAAMYAEVERLDKAIEEENKARKLADELLQKGLDAEIARAKAAEIVLQQNIDTNTSLIEDEEKRAKDAEEKLTIDLHDETTARIAEDKKINDTVETNRQHAEEVDAQLFDSIRTEANLRKNADNVLSDRIDKETEERKDNDASINTRIDSEHAERVKADNELDKRITDNQQNIEHEVERAKSAETNLNDALEREIDARVDTDRSLENSIDANDRASKERDNKLQGEIDANDNASKDRDKQLQANIDTEIANRGNAENAINDRITNEINDRKADDASINTRIDKETEERKNDIASLNTRVDTEQNERVKSDNALDKRVTDNAQAIEHETERAKSAETNLNDALEREVDARQDDTRNLENQIDKVNNDSKNRYDDLQNSIDTEIETREDTDKKLDDRIGINEQNIKNNEDNILANKTEFANDVLNLYEEVWKRPKLINIKSAELSHITIKRDKDDTENATITIGDTFDADFNKVNTDIETEKQRAIAKENELSGKVEHETQERQTETTTLNAEVLKRPTLDKFIAGENITLTPDVDKTTLTIAATTDENKVNTLINDNLNSVWNTINENSSKIGENQSNIKELDTKYNATYNTSNIENRIVAGDNINIEYRNGGESVFINAKNSIDADTLKDMQQNIGKNHTNIENLQSDMSSLIANSNIHGDKYIKVKKTSDNNNRLEYNLSFNDSYATSVEPDSLLTLIKKDVLGDVSTTVQQEIPEILNKSITQGDGILINKGSDKITISNNRTIKKLEIHSSFNPNSNIIAIELGDTESVMVINSSNYFIQLVPNTICDSVLSAYLDYDRLGKTILHVNKNILSENIEFTAFVFLLNNYF